MLTQAQAKKAAAAIEVPWPHTDTHPAEYREGYAIGLTEAAAAKPTDVEETETPDGRVFLTHKRKRKPWPQTTDTPRLPNMAPDQFTADDARWDGYKDGRRVRT